MWDMFVSTTILLINSNIGKCIPDPKSTCYFEALRIVGCVQSCFDHVFLQVMEYSVMIAPFKISMPRNTRVDYFFQNFGRNLASSYLLLVYTLFPEFKVIRCFK